MVIRDLANTDIGIIVQCLTKSFQNYFVEMPSDVTFWDKRFSTAKVDYNLSFGAFDNEKLVAFIIHGFDEHNGELTAYNTGTGVLEDYRGRKLVDQIYDFALPILTQKGVKKCLLEVIEENHVAARVYERIGFSKVRLLKCFKGELEAVESSAIPQETDIELLMDKIAMYQKYYSWDNSINTILTGRKIFKSYTVHAVDGQEIGYFIINTNNNSLIQIEAYDEQNLIQVIGATKKIISPLRINNIDGDRVTSINAFNVAGLENHINQFEMEFYF